MRYLILKIEHSAVFKLNRFILDERKVGIVLLIAKEYSYVLESGNAGNMAWNKEIVNNAICLDAR